MEKTISHLNSKSWYRLLKVAYIFSFLVVCTLTVFLIFSSNYRTHEVLDRQNTKIICQLGNKKQFSQKEIFGNDDISHFTPFIENWKRFIVPSDGDPEIEKILKLCEISDDELITYANQPHQSIRAPYEWEEKYIAISDGIFMSLIYSLMGLAVTALVFEVIRRVFYYVILGIFKPKK